MYMYRHRTRIGENAALLTLRSCDFCLARATVDNVTMDGVYEYAGAAARHLAALIATGQPSKHTGQRDTGAHLTSLRMSRMSLAYALTLCPKPCLLGEALAYTGVCRALS